MELFTKIDIPVSNFKIDYSKKLAFIGSCFAENISKRFTDRKFCTLVNPFGTIYNPISICTLAQNIASGKVYTEQDVFFGDGKWNSYDAHSSLSVYGEDARTECINNLNKAISNAHDFLKSADIMFITLGTAFAYYLKETESVVCNCHRQNANLFTRKLISVAEATEGLQKTIAALHKLNANMQIVFTVSPLRHLSDGAHENNLSKSTLHLAVNEAKANYFPSYEIVMDELRDYRFYDSDMVHLSATAEDYIFERMVASYCDSCSQANIKRVEKFMKTVQHRIINASDIRTAQFARQQIATAQELEKQIAGLNLSAEKLHFNQFLI